MVDFQSLIEQVEQLGAPSEPIDQRIALAIGWKMRQSREWYDPATVEEARRAKRGLIHFVDRSHMRHPAYTHSTDVAATLIAPGYEIAQIGQWNAARLREKGPWLAILEESGKVPNLWTEFRCNHAWTMTLALVSAALRTHLPPVARDTTELKRVHQAYIDNHKLAVAST